MENTTPAANSATPAAVALPPALTVEELSVHRDQCIIMRAATRSEKVRERLWRAASEFESARKILAAELRKAAKGEQQ